jgi:predicted permease
MAEIRRPEARPAPRLRVAGVRVLETLAIVISIFGPVGLGYGAARTRLLGPKVGEGLTEFVFKVAIPILLFGTLATADLHGLSPWRVWAAYFVPFTIIWALSHLMIRRIFGRDARAGVVAGGSAAFSNAVLIGLPLMQAAYGEAGTVYLIVIVAVHLPIMMLVSVFLNEWALAADEAATREGRGEVLRRLAKTLITHPILLAILAGLMWRVSGLEIPTTITLVVEQLGKPAGPLALFASGMALQNFGIARQIRPAFAIAALKLLVMPALVYAACRLAGLPPVGVAAVTLVAACPTGVNAFLVADRLGTGQALASNALLISTAAAVLTVTLWLALLQGLPG